MYNNEEKVETILGDLNRRGSDLSNLKSLRNDCLKLVRKNLGLEDSIIRITKNMAKETSHFLNSKNDYGINFISGISSCIYLPSSNDAGYVKVNILGGLRKRYNLFFGNINRETKFDIASITKLYTLVLLFRLEELGVINLNDKIADLNPEFSGLGDYTFNDLIRLHGKLRTNGNIAKASSEEEAYEILKTLYLVNDDRSQNEYTDFGAIVIGDTLEKVFANKFHQYIKFEDIMRKYLFEPLDIKATTFNPESNNISGNGNDLRLCHDPKAQKLGGAVGSAGLFTTSNDLARLADGLFGLKKVNGNRYLSHKYLSRLGEVTFPNALQSAKGNLGVYVKHPLGLQKTYTPSEFATGSFSHQGWTGSLATFDPYNLIHQNFLVNAIYHNDNQDLIKNDKPIGFGSAFGNYFSNMTYHTMLIYVAKQYYNRYCRDCDEVNLTAHIGKTSL